MNPEQNPTPEGANSNDTPSQPQVIGPQQSQQPSSPSPQSQSPSPNAYGQSAYQPPVVASQPALTGVAEADKPKRWKRPRKRFLAFVAVLVVALGGGAYAYWQVLNNSPEKVLADALANTMTDVLDRKPIKTAGTFKYESKDKNAPYSVTIDIETKQTQENGQVAADLQFKAEEGFEVNVKGTVVYEASGTGYVKFDNLRETINGLLQQSPLLGAVASAYDPIIEKIDGRWIKIDRQGLTDLGFTVSEEKVDKCSEELEKLRISKDDQKRVKEIFTQNQFAIASEELPAEAIDGDSSFHYKLDLNEEAGLKFAKEFVELQSFAAVKEACEIKQEDIDESLEELKEQTKGDEEIEAKPVFELWVSKGTRRPTKVKVTLDDKEVSMENIATIKLDAKDVHVDIPTDFITLKELRDEIQKAFDSTTDTLSWSDIRGER